MRLSRLLPLSLAMLLAACDGARPADPLVEATAPLARPEFPVPDRPVADIVSATWSDEESRDSSGEAEQVFDLLGIGPGSRVADIGAGIGYYTVRLARRVAPGGQVYANDIMPDYLARLRRRVTAQGLANVTLVLGDPGDARLAAHSIDVAILAHMYHEVSDPFGLLWHLHDSLRGDGRVAIVDADRSTTRHGTPQALLLCEMTAVGYRQLSVHRLQGDNYLAVFAPGQRPPANAITPCRADDNG